MFSPEMRKIDGWATTSWFGKNIKQRSLVLFTHYRGNTSSYFRVKRYVALGNINRGSGLNHGQHFRNMRNICIILWNYYTLYRIKCQTHSERHEVLRQHKIKQSLRGWLRKIKIVNSQHRPTIPTKQSKFSSTIDKHRGGDALNPQNNSSMAKLSGKKLYKIHMR